MEEKEETKKVNSTDPEEKTDNTDQFKFFSTNWKTNIVSDEDAPKLYSRKVIYIFSILFSVITGGILLALNLKRINKTKAIWNVLGYSIAYTAISVAILNKFERSTILTLLVSMLGSFALYNSFWKKHIGAETKYQTKSIWIPLIICLAISTFFIWAIMVTEAY